MNTENCPPGWKLMRLGELLLVGSGDSGAYDSGDFTKPIPVYGANGPIGSHTTANFGPGYVIGRVGAAGEVSRVDQPVWASDNTLTAKPLPDRFDFAFAGHALEFVNLAKLTTKSAQPLLTQTKLKSFELVVPPLSEQRRIAEVLDTVDAAIRQTDAVIAKQQRVKTGLLQDLLTRGLDEHGRLRDPERHPEQFKDSPLGRIPKAWDIEVFGEHVESSMFGPRFSSEHYADDGAVATMRTTDMDQEGSVNLATMPRADLDPSAYRKHVLRPWDILISRSGTIGITSVYKGFWLPVLPGAFLIRFRLLETLRPQFIRYYFNSAAGRRRIEQQAAGGVQKNVKGSTLLEMRVPIPSVDEQGRILNVMNTQEEELAAQGLYRDKLQRLKDGLMQDLLTGRVRVPEAEAMVSGVTA